MNCIGPECERPVAVPSTKTCRSHYAQLNRGEQLRPLANRGRGRTDELIEQGAAAQPGPCLLSDHQKGRMLTPQATKGVGRTTAARAVWQLVYGDIPVGLEVLHWCHDHRCLNVHHLYLGTAAENAADRKALYELGRQLVWERVQAGGPGYARGSECAGPPRGH